MRSANTNQGCWPSSKDSFESSTSVLLEVLAAFEDLLDLVVDLVETERDLGRHWMDAAVHADRLHALQELDVQKVLRRPPARNSPSEQVKGSKSPFQNPPGLLSGGRA